MSTDSTMKWSIDDALSWYQHLGIPHFQRGLVWAEEAVSLLLESVYYDTPCGTIILWRPERLEGQGIPLPGSERFDHLIVDGQQRIRMLHAALDPTDVETQDSSGRREPTKRWCIDLTALPELVGLIDERRSGQRPFVRIVDPLATRNPKYRHNLIPLHVLLRESTDALEPYLELIRPTSRELRPPVLASLHRVRSRVAEPTRRYGDSSNLFSSIHRMEPLYRSASAQAMLNKWLSAYHGGQISNTNRATSAPFLERTSGATSRVHCPDR